MVSQEDMMVFCVCGLNPHSVHTGGRADNLGGCDFEQDREGGSPGREHNPAQAAYGEAVFIAAEK